MKNLFNIVIICFFTLISSGCSLSASAPVDSLGISTDGRYVITAHGYGELILWDTVKKEKKLMAKNANTESAYFIPDSHEFMWQDTNNVVHIQNVNGQEIKQFPHFETEGHIITADKSFYLSADKWGKLYKGYGDNLVPVYTDNPISSFQPYSLSIFGNYILSTNNTVSSPEDPPAETKLTANPVNPDMHKKSSYNGVTLWNKTTLKPIARLWGNTGRTTGKISPDGKWVVTGSDSGGKVMWEINNLNNRIRLIGRDGTYNAKTGYLDNSKVLPIPEKFDGIQAAGLYHILAVAFVSEKDFILFDRNAKSRIHPIYTTGDSWIQAYVDLGKRKSISQSNLSIGSAPKANILAISQGTGIAVYRYHPATKELEKIWQAD
ncbi:WD40 repeat domain-containing protein [Glaesserella sp.]|uniref:WD40 repeat domain-containing protein n=1 Tax=Glaesserella sp. TaxID=2094731 RepID=UPI00359FC2CC